MLKLNGKEQQIIKKAITLIEKDINMYSCSAILNSDGWHLSKSYGFFYDKCPFNFWQNEDGSELTKEQRLIMLELFLIANS